MELKNKHACNIGKYICAYVIVAAVLLICQSIPDMEVYGRYYSDFPAHLAVTKDTWYSMYHLPVLIVGHFIKIDLFGLTPRVVASTATILLCDVISIYAIRKFLMDKFSDTSYADFLSISLLFVSMLIPFWQDRWYVGIGTPNPWHNPTYRMARPFAILSYCYFLKVYEKLHLKWNGYKKDLVLFSLFSALSCAAKPSFLIAAVPAFFVMFVYKLINERFKNFLDCFFVGLSLIPSGLILLLQNYLTFQTEQRDVENQVCFGINDVWSRGWLLKGSSHLSGINSIDNLISFCFTIAFAAGFPLLVSLVQAKHLRLSQKCSLLIYLSGTLINLFIYEEGPRKYHGNFGWSYLFSLFFMFLAALEGLVCNPPKNKAIRYGCWLLFCIHLMCGLLYFLKVLLGYAYV